jgi:hypothetical protein
VGNAKAVWESAKNAGNGNVIDFPTGRYVVSDFVFERSDALALLDLNVGKVGS